MPEFDSAGVRIHYELAGPDDGQATLLLHGYASDYGLNWVGTRWQETLTRAGRLIVGPDLRGHGRSDKPHETRAYDQGLMSGDAARLLEHLELEPADCVGYSMGAHLALRLAIDHPEQVRRLVLGGLGRMGGFDRAKAIAARMRGDDSVDDPMAIEFQAFAATRPTNDLEALASCILGWRPRVEDAELRSLDLPVLLVVGDRDDRARGAEELAAMIPGARLVRIPGRDHMNAVPSRQFKEAALEFLDS